ELLFVKKVTHAFIPFRGSSEAAGFDLLSCHSVDILAGTTGCINTGIQVVLPKNTYGRIADRSSMAIKSLAVLGGVIDRDYTGSIIIMLHNFGLGEASVVDEWKQSTSRGVAGFGSTGYSSSTLSLT
ncbi:Deoxyuridine 5'-triphosphate nucleotidohydrolase, partial [Orchesella cincta]